MTPPTGRAAAARAWLTRGDTTVYLLLIAIFAVIFWLNPSFAAPPSMMAFAKKAAPLVILAIGQYLVIVAGELDLSVGSLVGAQVVIAARLINGVEERTWWVLALMVAFGLLVGVVNGLVTTVLKVPSIITTLGMMLVLFGAIRLWTGGAPTGALSEAFRIPGRGGIRDVPLVGEIPWALLVVVVAGAIAAWCMRRPFGRTLITVGDNDRAAAFAGVSVGRTRTIAFVLSSLMATLAGILIGGFAGVTAQVGQGLEFTAITAVVLGGVVLGGGRGAIGAAIAGAVVVEGLFTVFNQLALPSTIRPAAQGVIIIAAVAWAARAERRGHRTEPVAPQPTLQEGPT